MEDWDLQAIVKGCSRPSSSSATSLFMEDPNFYSNFLSEDQDEFSCVYPQFFETTATSSSSSVHDQFDEGVGSSIFPVLHPLIPHPNNSPSISDLLREFKEPEKLHHNKQIITPSTKQKQSKKSRQNRVVKEVKADSVCSDSWGWRKYGQKPIKGSPYPRSYYRCSSSKGCSARKQVERSLSNPDVFVVTYTAEHNHAEPTRRNALAGTTRKKFPTTNPSFDIVDNHHMSPNSIEELEQPVDQGVAEGQVLMNMPFQISTEDFFPGLEDLLFG